MLVQKRVVNMKNKILFVGKISKNLKNIENDYNVITVKDALSGYKAVYKETPDLIIYNTEARFFEGYHLSKLLNTKEDTSKIPFVIIGSDIPENIDFNADAQFSEDLEYDDIKGMLENIISENELPKNIKEKILKSKPSAKEITERTQNILDELLMTTSIVEDFKGIVDSINFEEVLSGNIFNIIKKYLPYDICGLYFNESDDSTMNNLNLSANSENISIDLVNEVKDKFFDEMEKYKRICELQCNIIDGLVKEKSNAKYDDFKTVVILPFKYGTRLAGGIYLATSKTFDLYESVLFDIIARELEALFKIRYMFNEQAKHSLLDSMTGLYNRQEFDSAFEFEFFKGRRYIYNISIAILDIDDMKGINEKYGKEYGDFVITELASLLKRVFRRTDRIYRFKGETIAIMLPFTPITKALIPIERLRNEISKYDFTKDDIKTNISVCVGLSANYSRFTEPEHLLEGVTTALTRAKEKGRNRLDIFE